MVCQVWRLVYKSTEWQMSGQMMMIMRYVVYRRLSCKINYNCEKWDYRNRSDLLGYAVACRCAGMLERNERPDYDT